MVEKLDWCTLANKVGEFLGMESEGLARQTHIYEELGLDSLGVFSLGMHLIKIFGIPLPLSEVAGIRTLGDIYDTFDRFRPTET